MTCFVLSFVAAALLVSTAGSIQLLSPINTVRELLNSPARTISKSKSDPLPSMVSGNSLESNQVSSTESGVPVTSVEDPLCDESNVVDLFTSKFTNKILSSRRLSAVFSVTLSPREAEEVYYRVVYNAVENVNSCDSNGVSRIVSDAILDTFGNLTVKKHAQTYGHSVATYMKSRNVLTCENLSELCNCYIFYAEQAACNAPHIPDPRSALIQAASDSLVHFMTSLDLFTADSVAPVARDYANSLYLLSGVPRYYYSQLENIDETVYAEITDF